MGKPFLRTAVIIFILTISVSTIFAFKELRQKKYSSCFCPSVSSNVPISIKLFIENNASWEAGSYHLIKWKKSCNVSGILFQFMDEQSRIIEEKSFDPCNYEYAFKVPDNISGSCKLIVSGYNESGTTVTRDSSSINVAMGSESEYEWELLNPKADFKPRDGAISAVINDKMFLYGGWDPYDEKQTNSEMWTSEDGIKWEYMGNAPWERRHCAGKAFFNNKFWVIGGDCNQGYYQNDVWSTKDGLHWEKMLDSIPWRPRVNFGVQVFDNKIWIMGGERINLTVAEEIESFNDVYYSEDGIHWIKSNTGLPDSRAHLGRLSGLDKLFLIGGSEYQNRTTFNDVWTSSNGHKWERLLKDAPWSRGTFTNFIEFDNKIWMMGGNSFGMNSNEVWYSSDGYNWYKMEVVPWQARHASSLFNYKGSLIMAAGYLHNDVWRLNKLR